MTELSGKYFELCILIPCYNNIAGLRKSIETIRYDNGKYLIVIVDDGSHEEVTQLNIFGTDSPSYPVQIIRLQENRGITISLNTGLRWILQNIQCDYIARLDCGDICDPSRYYKQIDYLRVNTYVMLLGSWCYFKNPENNLKFSYRAPEHHPQIKSALYFRNVFIHPTVIFRREIFEKVGLYPQEYPHAEDYALCWKIANQAQTAVLPLYLVVCEINTHGISYANRIKQLQSRKVIVQKFGNKFALKILGKLKVTVLMIMPYDFILFVKKLIPF